MTNRRLTHTEALGRLDRSILLVRGQRVMLDLELAEIYGVPTKALNQAVKRNALRFPDDFAFRLTEAEKSEVVTNCDHLSRLKFSPSLPWAFTEHGAIMAANVLNSDQAIEMSVHVVRTFIRLRELALRDDALARGLRALEKRVGEHDQQLLAIIRRLRELSDAPKPRRARRIGFVVPDEE